MGFVKSRGSGKQTNYSHAIFWHALGDVEIEKDLSHGYAASDQVKESGEKYPAEILDAAVKVDYETGQLSAL